MATGLHAIESNNFVPSRSTKEKDFDRPTADARAASKSWAIPPAQDPIDLAERILTLYVTRVAGIFT
jgi:hypothetical protein